jgi:4-diphosphocytidyl-2-C-methyl-D-erythritol kinase
LWFDELIERLGAARNDLEPAAKRIAPIISTVIDAIGATEDCALARMSGSGATCFGLFASCRSAARAARVLRRDHPDWWVKATVLR